MKNKITIPNEWLGEPIAGAMERVLAATPVIPNAPSARPQNQSPVSTDINDPTNWLILPGRQHGAYQYGDISVCMHRLALSSEVEKAARDLGLSVTNSGQEKDGTPYIGNVNWEEALKLNLATGNITLNPRQGLDLMLDLREGIKGKKKIHDARGSEIDTSRLRVLYNEIWKKRDPWRDEWLDTAFGSVSNQLSIKYGHRLQGNALSAQSVVALTPGYVAEDTYVDITSANAQGMPTRKTTKESLFFYYPREGRVARFDAYSDGACLGCGRSAVSRGGALGVRAAKPR